MSAGPATAPPAARDPEPGVLPVADAARVRRAAFRVLRREPGALAVILALNGLATTAGLAGPWLLGRITDTVQRGGGVSAVDRAGLLIVLAAAVQIVLTRCALLTGARFGERLSAHIREEFLDRLLELPPAVVERAATGDLAARGSGDVATVAATLRDARSICLCRSLISRYLTWKLRQKPPRSQRAAGSLRAWASWRTPVKTTVSSGGNAHSPISA